MKRNKIKQFGNIVEHAGSGYKMPESMARTIDEASKGLPADFKYRRLAKSAVVTPVEVNERTDVSFITTAAVDRDGECVLPGGGDWSTYNRVVTLAHNYSTLPVGSNMWLKAKDNGIIAKTLYPTKPNDWGESPWLPSAILHLLQQDPPTCTGKSIGFLPLNVREATRKEIEQRPELKGVPMIDKWKGIEYAVTPVPCNPQAEMLVVSRALKSGIISDDAAEFIIKSMGEMQPAQEEGSIDQSIDEMPECPMCETGEQVSFDDVSKRYSCLTCGCNWPQQETIGVETPTKSADELAAEQKAKIDAILDGVTFVSPAQYLKAMREHSSKSQVEIRQLIHSEIRDIIDAARGRV